MSQRLQHVLAEIARKEREIKDAYRVYKEIERELEAAEARGSYIHPRRMDQWTQLDARVSQLAIELKELYSKRDATKVADAAANTVRRQLAQLNARGRRRQVA